MAVNSLLNQGLPDGVVLDRARYLKQVRDGERTKLDDVRRYWKGIQGLPAIIPSSAPAEVRKLAALARINVCAIVVDSLAQSMFVDNFRDSSGTEEAAWQIWQANKMDAKQSGIHRAAFAYGTAYAVVTPGDPYPVIRGVSPRNLTAVYGDDPDWPEYALEYRNGLWRLYDANRVYLLNSAGDASIEPQFQIVSSYVHGAGVTPVVRYVDEEDLDRDNDVTPYNPSLSLRDGVVRTPLLYGQIAPLMPIQDQIDLTTFSLLTSQWYTAFRQRYAIGWVPEDEMQRLKASGSQLWAFDKKPDELKLGEFEQTDLSGYLESRKESLRHAATLSQTPIHELVGDLVNLSAEALAAAEAGHERKVGERKTGLGESHEQMLRLAAQMAGYTVSDSAEVVWRETSTRSMAATVDALGKLAQMLGIPQEALWEKVPGATRQDVERWLDARQNSPAPSAGAA